MGGVYPVSDVESWDGVGSVDGGSWYVDVGDGVEATTGAAAGAAVEATAGAAVEATVEAAVEESTGYPHDGCCNRFIVPSLHNIIPLWYVSIEEGSHIILQDSEWVKEVDAQLVLE